MHGPISPNGDIYSIDASPPKILWFQIPVGQTVWKQEEITYFVTTAYTLLCKLNGYHN